MKTSEETVTWRNKNEKKWKHGEKKNRKSYPKTKSGAAF